MISEHVAMNKILPIILVVVLSGCMHRVFDEDVLFHAMPKDNQLGRVQCFSTVTRERCEELVMKSCRENNKGATIVHDYPHGTSILLEWRCNE